MKKLLLKRYWSVAPLLLFAQHAFAVSGGYVHRRGGRGFSDIAGDLTGFVFEIRSFVYVICVILGVGLLVGSVVQFKAYRENPSAVHISMPIVLLIIGLAMLGLAVIMKIYTPG